MRSESHRVSWRLVGPILKFAIRDALKQAFTNVRLWPIAGSLRCKPMSAIAAKLSVVVLRKMD
jgi:hypothetical protein